ncbi:MAG: MarR family winged helix-turn-helix transcriptional regulator [Sphingobium sp.]
MVSSDADNNGLATEADALSLVLFVHLAIAADADKQLSPTGLNRTHHRILFLIGHRPGVTVGELFNLLRVSAQAIQAPLRTLIDSGLIEQQSSERDRRKRHLILSAEGQAFLAELASGQFARIAAARKRAGEESFEGFMRVMRMMMDAEDRDWLYPRSSPAVSNRRFESRSDAEHLAHPAEYSKAG